MYTPLINLRETITLVQLVLELSSGSLISHYLPPEQTQLFLDLGERQSDASFVTECLVDCRFVIVVFSQH